MMYWIILIVLAVLILVTIIVTIVTIVKERKEYKNYELDDEYGIDEEDEPADEEDDDGYDYDERSSGKRRRAAPARKASLGGHRRRWKIILENQDTEEIYDFIFYDSLGIGRTTKEVAFEEFLSIPYDRKISKVHCSVVRGQDNLYLKDEGSKNHTYLNGKRVQKPIMIQKDDVISIGETDLKVIKILRETN